MKFFKKNLQNVKLNYESFYVCMSHVANNIGIFLILPQVQLMNLINEILIKGKK